MMLQAEYGSVIVGALAIGGQLANLVLNLKLRAGLLEQEQRIMERVEEKYMRKDVWVALEKRDVNA